MFLVTISDEEIIHEKHKSRRMLSNDEIGALVSRALHELERVPLTLTVDIKFCGFRDEYKPD